MQIRFDQPVSKHHDPIDSGADFTPSRPRSVAATRPDSLIPYHLSAPSSSVASATRPQFQEAHGETFQLSPAMQDAIDQDDWKACTAARGDSFSARVDDPGLLWHAAKAGANVIVFRLQSERVSAFSPDMKACAFHAALKTATILWRGKC